VQAGLLAEREAVLDPVLDRHRAVLVDLDDVERLARDIQRRIPQRVLGADLARHAVGLLARGDAGLAADAQRRVEQQADGVGRELLVAARLRRAGRRRAGGGRAGRLEEAAPVHAQRSSRAAGVSALRGWAARWPRFFVSIAVAPAAAPAIAASAAAAA